MFDFGLKLWSTNDNYIDEVISLYKENIYTYIELYTFPDSYKKYIDLWINLQSKYKIPFVVHAPHWKEGMNLAQKKHADKNRKLAEETYKFADKLNADIVIFHPGIAGNDEETIRQIKIIYDKRMVIENKPYYALVNDLVCNGNSPKSIENIIKNTNVGFCLDIGHAFCAANALKLDKYTFLNDFIKLNPKIYHLTDGDNKSFYDKHYHFNDGTYDIPTILKQIKSVSMITIETEKNSKNNLDDYKKDIHCLNNILKEAL
jgi:sugar phosphate isomerase/epimerase